MRKTAISTERLLNELEITIRGARAEKQHSVVVRALELGAKLTGLLTEKIDVQHTFGTREETLQAISARHGAEVADMLREALQHGPDAIVEDRRAFRAKDVTPKAKVDEIAAAKELIRTRD